MCFTQAELEELRRADEEIEKQFFMMEEEIEKANQFDREVKLLDKANLSRHQIKYLKNREKILAKARRYHENNRETILAKRRARKEHNNEYNHKWNEANRQKYAEEQAVIAKARERRGWSKAALAKELGVSPTTVWKLETGRLRADWDKLLEVMPELRKEVEI